MYAIKKKVTLKNCECGISFANFGTYMNIVLKIIHEIRLEEKYSRICAYPYIHAGCVILT